MPCKCGSERLVEVAGKTSDLCSLMYKGVNREGYLPSGIGIGGGDYMEFTYCLDCGTIQGKFPISYDATNEAFNLEEMPGNAGVDMDGIEEAGC